MEFSFLLIFHSDWEDEPVRAFLLLPFLCCHFIKFFTIISCFIGTRHNIYSCQMTFCKKYQSNLELLMKNNKGEESISSIFVVNSHRTSSGEIPKDLPMHTLLDSPQQNSDGDLTGVCNCSSLGAEPNYFSTAMRRNSEHWGKWWVNELNYTAWFWSFSLDEKNFQNLKSRNKSGQQEKVLFHHFLVWWSALSD